MLEQSTHRTNPQPIESLVFFLFHIYAGISNYLIIVFIQPFESTHLLTVVLSKHKNTILKYISSTISWLSDRAIDRSSERSTGRSAEGLVDGVGGVDGDLSFGFFYFIFGGSHGRIGRRQGLASSVGVDVGQEAGFLGEKLHGGICVNVDSST